MRMYICLNRAAAGRGIPFDQFVKLAADAGFPGADVEIGYALQHGSSASALRDLFESHRMRFGGWGVPFDWRADESKQADGLAELERFADIARELRIDHCATWLMPSSDLPFIENWNFHVRRLKPVAQTLADRGLRLGLEFVAPYHLRKHFKHEFIFTPGQMLELADAIGPSVGLLIDSFHARASCTPFEDLAKIPAQKIVLVHLNDAPDVPPWALQDQERLLPGDGALDLPSFVRALDGAGYNGPASLEVFNEDLRKLPPTEAARRAWSATQKTLQGVPLQ
jgi:sugar phosphate isomerase/epimerase